eukprot:CAMPEP_0196142050 /NCGR_PEP_ID=MMETSP0910-20130528/10870_1 /TAXON_ID=49265 /ORGANISM="Thalassiosira rotula, Strain GSO102" /LENGTH=154 /DNA_ID=CAMNT_0041403303 /DNA_START=125 /DNA_END=586 /DNA_ORIENTATION=+
MSKLAFALVAILLPSASAFSYTTTITSERRSTTKLSYAPQPETPETYVRAVDCANNYGLCSVDELLDLSEELDEFLECYIEDPEACEEEIDGRQNLSEALLVQGEMMEHEIYMEQGNNMFPIDAANAVERPMDDNSDNFNPQSGVWREEGGEYW